MVGTEDMIERCFEVSDRSVKESAWKIVWSMDYEAFNGAFWNPEMCWIVIKRSRWKVVIWTYLGGLLGLQYLKLT